MRRILTISCALALAAMSFVGCSEDPDEVKYYVTESSGPTPPGFNQLMVSVPDAVALSDSDNFSFTWTSEDRISIFEFGGDWVADMVVGDVTVSPTIFTIDGKLRLDDDKKYIAVYPPRSDDQLSYEDYIASIKDMSAEQCQSGATYDHLKGESSLEVEFNGSAAIKLESKKVVTTVTFGVDGATAPALLKYNDGVESEYALTFVPETKADGASKISYIGYMMTDPVEMTEVTRILSFAVSASDGTELTKSEIKSSESVDGGDMCNVDIEKGSVVVVKGGSSSEPEIDPTPDPDPDPDPDDNDGNNNTENLTPEDGAWE